MLGLGFGEIVVLCIILIVVVGPDRLPEVMKGVVPTGELDLYFGPQAPSPDRARWIQTIPRRGWFAYFRLYAPEAPAFDGSWKPGDFEEVK